MGLDHAIREDNMLAVDAKHASVVAGWRPDLTVQCHSSAQYPMDQGSELEGGGRRVSAGSDGYREGGMMPTHSVVAGGGRALGFWSGYSSTNLMDTSK